MSLKAIVAATVAASLAFAGAAVSPLSTPQTAQAETVSYAVGVTTLTTPASGSRYIYVATNGTDMYKQWTRQPCLVNPAGQSPYQDACPEPDSAHPLRTIQTAIRTARPGDVIVVRAGVYKEAIGWGLTRGIAAKRITLQAAPGERVELNGTLIMTAPDYWTIRGIRFTHNGSIQTGQSVVTIAGGNEWTFENNEVTGSTGVANLMVNASSSSGTVSQLQAAAARNYTISGNCIHDNRGTDAVGLDHNIYLMPSIYSTGGVITHNLIAGAPRGANIKAAAGDPTKPNPSPHNVDISYNTMLAASSGLIIGLSANRVESSRNIIAVPLGASKYDGAVKTYRLAAPGANSAKDSLLSGYPKVLAEDYGVTNHLYMTRNNTTTPFTYTGSIANCTAKAASASILATYGQFAN